MSIIPLAINGREGQLVAGRYELDFTIAEVNGASAWHAHDQASGQPVVVWLPPAGKRVAVEVIAAALATATLCDRRLARVLEADCASACPYIVAEWMSGVRLDWLLMTKLPRLSLALTIAVEATEALAHAHAYGLPHLSLTPRSLLWDGHRVLVTGLGIEAAFSGKLATSMPEAAAAVDARALGAVLYAMLTGYWPGSGKTALPRAPTYKGTVIPLNRMRPGLPPALDSITDRTLLPRHRARITSLVELAAELRSVRRSMVRPRPPMRARARPGLVCVPYVRQA